MSRGDSKRVRHGATRTCSAEAGTACATPFRHLAMASSIVLCTIEQASCAITRTCFPRVTMFVGLATRGVQGRHTLQALRLRSDKVFRRAQQSPLGFVSIHMAWIATRVAAAPAIRGAIDPIFFHAKTSPSRLSSRRPPASPKDWPSRADCTMALSLSAKVPRSLCYQ